MRVVERCYRLLLAPQAAAWHQANKYAPLGHPQALDRYVKKGTGLEDVGPVATHTVFRLKCFLKHFSLLAIVKPELMLFCILPPTEQMNVQKSNDSGFLVWITL